MTPGSRTREEIRTDLMEILEDKLDVFAAAGCTELVLRYVVTLVKAERIDAANRWIAAFWHDGREEDPQSGNKLNAALAKMETSEYGHG